MDSDFGCFKAKNFSRINPNGVPPYNNTQFDTTFTDSLLNFVRFLNPNNRGDLDNIAPFWNTWSDGKVEMLFNKTENDLPVVETITTSRALLDRCRYVTWYFLVTTSFMCFQILGVRRCWHRSINIPHIMYAKAGLRIMSSTYLGRRWRNSFWA